jgi:hypothetical protein
MRILTRLKSAGVLSLLVPSLAVLALGAASASASEGTPGWQVTMLTNPTVLSSSSPKNQYTLVVSNAGGAPTNGSPVMIVDTLPPGITVQGFPIYTSGFSGWSCEKLHVKTVVSCTDSTQINPITEVEETLRLGALQQLAPIAITVGVSPSIAAHSKVTNTVRVSGGGAPVATATETTEVETAADPLAPYPFEATDLSSFLANLNGEPDTQAGDHPNGLITSFGVSNVYNSEESFGKNLFSGENQIRDSQTWKDIVVDLPPGVLGNPQVTPQCPEYELGGGGGESGVYGHAGSSNCPPSSQVATMGLVRYGKSGGINDGIKVFNMVPESNEPAEFTFAAYGVPLGIFPTIVGEGAKAHIRVTTPGIPVALYTNLSNIYLKFFGNPNEQVGGETGAPNAFFTNSSDCAGGPLVTELHVDSYEDPGSWIADGASVKGTPNFTDGVPDFGDPAWKGESVSSPAVTGCERLHFDPALLVQPETTKADEPSGFAVNLSVPQNPDPHGLASPPFKSVTVTLPSGVSLSPSAGDGLQACSEAQFEPQSNLESSCPNASVLGTVTASTPLLATPLTGYVFLGAPECDPCTNQDATDGKMYRLLIQVEGSGVVQKVQGTVDANSTTGQLTATFPENPQFPVSNLKLQFKGGLRAGLATPQSCGQFTATSDMVPWSTPYTPDATPSASLNVSWNGQGEACPSTPPLTPSFSAGTSNSNAGQFSPLTLTFSREDRQQDLSQISVSTPPGLLGTLQGVPLCQEPQAAQGTCSEASQIGKMTVAAGPGGHPFYEQGKVYLTGSYKGSPFGLSIVVPTQAGPFNLGTVVVRAQITINPETTALTVTSDPLPQILDGIPLRLRTANVTIDRPGFIFNPTNCAQLHINATIVGVQGSAASVSSPFAVAGCAGLHFGPTFTVSTTAHSSRADGASLDAKLVFPANDGAQSNIAHVKVELPKRLPSRLTTLQKACPEATFNTDPASCPTTSAIGVAKATTPVLPVPLEGPVYFVSHGGAAFPDLVVVLQGYGVRVDLTAKTFISKQGVTSSTFESIPDVPVNSFELYLPQGPYSALAANGNLCKGALAMPTSFIAQDGAQLKQNTRINVTGCPTTKTKKTKKPKNTSKASKASKAGHSGAEQGRSKS